MKSLFFLALAASLSFATVKNVDNIPKGQIVTWETGDTILLKGIVFVDSSILKIQPGVVVKAKKTHCTYNADDEVYEIDSITALVVTQKGFIDAQGERENPVIFTSELDNLNGKEPVFASSDSFFGLWGGVVLLGSARISKSGGSNRFMPAGEEDERCDYGGTDDEDSSGIMRYVSIRFAGAEHVTHRDEYRFAGLALCGVGSKTLLDHIDIYKSYNDGARFHGGTANVRYLASHLCWFDGVQCDEGYRGELQFVNVGLTANQLYSGNERCAVRIGGIAAVNDTPFTRPFIANATLFSTDRTINSVQFYTKGGGYLHNSIIWNLSDFTIEVKTFGANKESSWFLKNDSLLDISGNLFWSNMQEGINWSDCVSGDSTLRYIRYNRNELGNPRLRLSSSSSDSIDMRPDTSLCWNRDCSKFMVKLSDKKTAGFVNDAVCYAGAFSPSTDTMWITGWTGFDRYLNLSTAASRLSTPEDSLCECQTTGVITVARENRIFATPSISVKRNRITVAFDLPAPQDVVVNVFRLDGACVFSRSFSLAAAGRATIALNLERRVPGVYAIRVASAATGALIYNGTFLKP